MDSTALSNTCPACGAKITFNPKLQKWDCEFCGSKFTLEEMQKAKNASSKEANIKTLPKSNKKIDAFRCENCGAEIVADENTVATFCVYCGSTAILKAKIDEGVSPTLIIPFKKVKEDAVEAFKKVVMKPLTPRAFKSSENIEKITGVYIPFWAHDIVGDGKMDFSAKDIRTWYSGDYMNTETRIYNVTVEGHYEFDKVLSDASSRFDDDLMDSLEPFDFNDLVDYNHAYLSGFFAEKYDVEQEKGYERARQRVVNSSIDLAKSKVGHQTSTVSNNSVTLKNENCYCIMLPVWMVNIKYKGKMHTFAMNGDTGKIVGDIPIGVKETVLWSIGLFILFFALCFAIVYFGGI